MAMNQVQFQPGLSMAEFVDRYGSEDRCEAALTVSRWPEGFACPACDSGQSSSFRRQGRRIQSGLHLGALVARRFRHLASLRHVHSGG